MVISIPRCGHRHPDGKVTFSERVLSSEGLPNTASTCHSTQHDCHVHDALVPHREIAQR